MITKPERTVGALLASATVAAGLLVGTGASGANAAPAPETRSFSAVDDTYVVEHAPNRVLGGSTRLAASAVRNKNKIAYLKFAVRDLPSGVKADVRLRLTSLQPLPSNLQLYRVPSTSWGESTMTWNTRPALGTLVQTLRPATSADTVTFDLSSMVTGNGTYGVAIRTTDSTRNAGFASDEATSGKPSLSLTWTPACAVSAKLVPSCGAWWGVAANPLTSGQSWDQALMNFESQMGRPAGIAHYYMRGETKFPTAEQISRAREPGKERLLLINWKPSMTHTWRQIANGAVDARIDAEAAYIKANFPERFFLAIHHEPEDNVSTSAGSGMTAADYRDMFRHVVQRLRANGVTNVVTVMNYMGIPKWGAQPWFDTLYPGDDVVDWIAEDPYSFGTNSVWRAQFGGMVDRRESAYPSWPGFYTWATTQHPGKPIMLSEWGVDEWEESPGWKAGFFDNALAEMQRYPKIKAMVYWNQNEFPVGTTRIDSSASSLSSYKRLSGQTYLNPEVP